MLQLSLQTMIPNQKLELFIIIIVIITNDLLLFNVTLSKAITHIHTSRSKQMLVAAAAAYQFTVTEPNRITMNHLFACLCQFLIVLSSSGKNEICVLLK